LQFKQHAVDLNRERLTLHEGESVPSVSSAAQTTLIHALPDADQWVEWITTW
jgi:hypothetical protein